MAERFSVSVILPTFRREELLVNTIDDLIPQLAGHDEIIVVDQTPSHDASTDRSLHEWTREGAIRWFRKNRPSQGEAMNFAAWVARGDVLLFLDDDIVPAPNLVAAHRSAHENHQPTAVSGQVLQPWNATAVKSVRDFELGFDTAYDRSCEIVSLMGANFSIPRELFITVGGMDENFWGSNYRNDAELAFRLFRRTGRKIRFVPEASVRHLLAPGGNRAFGAKDTWGHIGGSIGDYYFAIRSLPPMRVVRHMARRLVRAPVNRATLRRPWQIPSLALREIVAVIRAFARITAHRDNFLKPLSAYADVEEISE